MLYCLNPTCSKLENPDEARFCQNCGASLLLDQRYRAIAIIGRGGFGRTYLAADQSQPDLPECVIKLLLPHQPGVDPQKVAELFRQEADRLAELGRHPQIPQLLAHYETDTAQYLVQEFIDGQNLEETLVEDGVFSEAEILELLEDLLPVLRFIHEHRVIHRDIKPENIIRPYSQARYVLVDFGASKSATATALARTGTVIGSAGYVAPEQAMGRAEFTSDLYSLGVTCIHLLTGLHPFDLYSVSEDAWVWQQYLPQPVRPSLRKTLDKLLQRATSQRYPNATAVLQDLGLEAHPRRRPAPSTAAPSTAAAPWQLVQTLLGHQGGITAIALHPSAPILASGSTDRTIKLWQLDSGKLLHTFAGRSLFSHQGHRDRITALAFSPVGDILFSGSEDGTIKEWDIRSRQLVNTLPEPGWGISALTVSEDGWTLVSGGGDGVIHFWDLERQKCLKSLAQHQDWVSGLILSPDEQTLISSSFDKSIRLWDLKSDRLLNTLMGHVERVTAIAITPDWQTLISGSTDKTLKIWDLPRGELRRVLAAHQDAVNAIAIDPHQEWFASGSEDGTLTIWDLQQAERITTLRHSWAVSAIAFTPEGDRLISGSADETLKIWQYIEGEP
ncbi:MAG: protein kinase [Oculatellaceae cyanobacterium Prado106]|jgi:WD40 repeat protein|nr:protein kinase [Oculatellaceae cyanobacterium Prado106]